MRERFGVNTASVGNEKEPDGSMNVSSYILSVERERSYKRPRFLWTVCAKQKPDELLSWGDSPTRDLALAAANDAIERFVSGSTNFGRVRNPRIRDR